MRVVFHDVPVTVEQDHNIRRDQIDAQTTCTSRQQEDEFFAVGSIVVVNRADTILMGGSTVNTAIF